MRRADLVKNGWGEISISRFKYPRTYTQHSGGSEFHLQRPGTPASRRRMIYRTPIKSRLSRYNNHKAYPEKMMIRATLREYSAAFPFSINCAGEAPALPGPHLNNVMKLAGNFLITTVIESRRSRLHLSRNSERFRRNFWKSLRKQCSPRRYTGTMEA